MACCLLGTSGVDELESLHVEEIGCEGCMTNAGGATQEVGADPVDIDVQVPGGGAATARLEETETADASVQSDNNPPCIESAVIEMLQSLKGLTETVNRLSEVVERSRAQDEKENTRVSKKLTKKKQSTHEGAAHYARANSMLPERRLAKRGASAPSPVATGRVLCPR